MKVINPSYKIYPLQGTSEEKLLKHIEYCGRICCKSRDKITPDSYKEFVERIKKQGHDSVLEMGNIVIKIWKPLPSYFEWFNSSFITISLDPNDIDIAYFSGSPRAFLEVFEKFMPSKSKIAIILQKKYPFLFGETTKDYKVVSPIINCLTNEQIKVLPWETKKLHCKIAVEFKVNRAVSHELVRHRISSYMQESQRYCRYKDDVVFIRPLLEYGSHAYFVWEEVMQLCENNYRKLLKTESPQIARSVLPNSTCTHIICYTNIKQWKHILEQRCSSKCDPNMYTLMRKLLPDMSDFIVANYGE